MKVVSIKREKIDTVKVIVGSSVTGSTNIKRPTKSITLKETTVDEVFDKISKCLESEDGKA